MEPLTITLLVISAITSTLNLLKPLISRLKSSSCVSGCCKFNIQEENDEKNKIGPEK